VSIVLSSIRIHSNRNQSSKNAWILVRVKNRISHAWILICISTYTHIIKKSHTTYPVRTSILVWNKHFGPDELVSFHLFASVYGLSERVLVFEWSLWALHATHKEMHVHTAIIKGTTYLLCGKSGKDAQCYMYKINLCVPTSVHLCVCVFSVCVCVYSACFREIEYDFLMCPPHISYSIRHG